MAAGYPCTTVTDCVVGTQCSLTADNGYLCVQRCQTNVDCANLGIPCDLGLGWVVDGVEYGVCHD